jgi:hypothetical protein
LVIAQLAQAQSRNANWVFGSGVWIHFPDSLPQGLPYDDLGLTLFSLNDPISDHSACISDTAGQFVLLADDHGIRNALFGTVAGGSAADLGWSVPAGNYLILPVPGLPERYGVFINELPPSSRAGYVEVDVAANGGTGAVVGSGTLWYMERATAKISATVDSSETGYWVVQHKDSGDTFLAFHFTSGGLADLPVTSNVGSDFLPEVAPHENVDRLGQMIFSKPGTLLAVAKLASSLDTSKIEFFQFDRATGQLDLWSELGMDLVIFPGGPPLNFRPSKVLGLDFDPSGQHLYLALASYTSYVADLLIQCSMASPDNIAATSYSLLGTTDLLDSTYIHLHAPTLAVAPPGQLLFQLRGNTTLPGRTMRAYTPPLADIVNGGHNHESTFYDINPLAGFPTPCKRYVNIAPVTTAIAEGTMPNRIGIRPNPMADRSALVFSGATQPESLIWRNALGSVLRRTAVGQVGPTYTIERNGLPAGLYMVEVLGKKGSLGVVKVICE